MIKTQIQLPDELYRRVKAFAASREWSLAETMRRGVESFLDRYPEENRRACNEWEVPSSERVGWKGLNAAQLRDVVHGEMDRHSGEKAS